MTAAPGPALAAPGGGPIDDLVRDALALAIRLRRDQPATEQAWDAIGELRARYPGRFVNLVWEQDSYGGALHYDVLVELAAGTLSISYCADDEVPWPARGLQRVNEAVVVRVNDEAVHVDQVVTSLDYAWHKLHVGRHLIDMAVIDQALRDRQIEASDEQLEAALLEFRQRRRLFSAAAFARWLGEHGMTQVQLESHLRREAARGVLRAEVIARAGSIEAYFAAHRGELDRVQIARISLADRGEAEALRRALCATLAEGSRGLLAAAQQRFLEGGGGGGELFATVRRDELDPDQAALVFATAPGELAPVIASGAGFDVVQVLRALPAVLDDDARAAIGDRMFAAWLAEQRAAARVEWFWGAAEAADVPALAL